MFYQMVNVIHRAIEAHVGPKVHFIPFLHNKCGISKLQICWIHTYCVKMIWLHHNIKWEQ